MPSDLVKRQAGGIVACWVRCQVSNGVSNGHVPQPVGVDAAGPGPGRSVARREPALDESTVDGVPLADPGPALGMVDDDLGMPGQAVIAGVDWVAIDRVLDRDNGGGVVDATLRHG